MRILLALLFGALLTAAAPQPARDWRTNTGVAPVTGGFTVGNPAAKVALVEYLSFTCPHCGHFFAESKAVLHDVMVRNGSVRVETRSAVRDPFDLAAWVVARCGGPRRFQALGGAIFAGQEGWLTRGQAWVQANLDAVKAMPQAAQLRAIADNSGLAAIGAQHGVTPAALTACFTGQGTLDPLLKMTDAAFAKISGTPGFEINGTLAADTYDWAHLEPKLRAAGAR
ncbi:DsbA family protein [Sphingomonas sp.]|uniref:DsbA family protein n=1 Tax=Sphingomonas sp. TaxID=28214 RepID=UPI002B857B7D|nr:thioredoxin domain-containing protein [Sphingomonas sp.]HWK36665.1 thioredoxin domain-containing protein [Sphingomonas sp.]